MKYKRQNNTNGSNINKANTADEKSSKGSSCNNVTDEDEDDESRCRSADNDNDDNNKYSLDMVFNKSRVPSSTGSNMFANRAVAVNCSLDTAKVSKLDESSNCGPTSPIVNGRPISATAITNQSTRKNQPAISTIANNVPNKSMIKRTTPALIKRTAKRKDCSFSGKKHSNALPVETSIEGTESEDKLSSNVENAILNYSPMENHESTVAASHLLQTALSNPVAKYRNNPPQAPQTEVNMLVNGSSASSMNENCDRPSKMLLFSQCQMTIRTLKTTATTISNSSAASAANPVQPNSQGQLVPSISVPSYGYNCLPSTNIDNAENNQPVLLNKQINAYHEDTGLMSSPSYPLSTSNNNMNSNPQMYNQPQSFKTNYLSMARGPVKTKPYICNSDVESDFKNGTWNNNFITTGEIPHDNQHAHSHLSYGNNANYENQNTESDVSPNCDFVSKMLLSTTINTPPNNINMTEVSVNNPFGDYSPLSYNGGNYAATNNSHNINSHHTYGNEANVHYDNQCSLSTSVTPANQYYSTDALRNHYQSQHQALSHGHRASSEYSAIMIKQEQEELPVASTLIHNNHYQHQQPFSNYGEYYPANNHYPNHFQHQHPHSTYYANNEYCNENGYL